MKNGHVIAVLAVLILGTFSEHFRNFFNVFAIANWVDREQQLQATAPSSVVHVCGGRGVGVVYSCIICMYLLMSLPQPEINKQT
jgi:hypothetical protein